MSDEIETFDTNSISTGARCVFTFNEGQCRNRVMTGSDYCETHGGGRLKREADECLMYQFQKAKYRQRTAELKGDDQIKSLREEIALVRMFLEQRINLIKDDIDLLSAYAQINSYVLTIEKLIKTAHQVERDLGNLISKSTIIILGQELGQILTEELKQVPGFEQIVDRTCDRLLLTIDKTTNIDE